MAKVINRDSSYFGGVFPVVDHYNDMVILLIGGVEMGFSTNEVEVSG